MNMIRGAHTPEGRAMIAASMARSLLVRGGPSALGPDADPPLDSFVHDGSSGHVALWWGPVVSVEPGDRVYYVPATVGMAVESVERAEGREPEVKAEVSDSSDRKDLTDEEIDAGLMLLP